MSFTVFRCFRFGALLAPALLIMTSTLRADVFLDWNQIACEVFKQDVEFQNPGLSSRSMAMMNIAMYDAVNGLTPRYQPFYGHQAPPALASPEAAAIQAAYHVLSSNYPSQQSYLDAALATSLYSFPTDAATTNGIDYGERVAKDILAMRAADGFENTVHYSPSGEVGHWEPDPLNTDQQAWGPEWGQIDLFGLHEVDTLYPAHAPDLTSQEYTDAFNEVKELGAKNSSTRTQEQTDIAYFWAYDRNGMGTPMRLYNDVVREVAENENNDLMDNSRLFAMSSTAVADAGIVAWNSKFKFDFWRPISGIRRANEDGNDDTEADPNWEPLGSPGGIAPDGSSIDNFTPPFPTFLSGHAAFGSALFRSLENFYGTDEIEFEIRSEEMPGQLRSFESFSEAAAENGRSRVYLGIHWSFDDTIARQMGSDIADEIAREHFQPVPEPSSLLLALISTLPLLHRVRRSRRS